MKVALVLDKFDPSVGGLEKWAYQFSQWLLEAGYEVHVVAFEFSDIYEGAGIIPHRLQKSFSKLERARIAEKLLRELKVDVIHDTGVGWHFDILNPGTGSKIANYHQDLKSQTFFLRIRIRISPYYFRKLREIRALEQRQYTASPGIFIAKSRMVQNQMESYYGVDPDRIRLVYPGVDTEQFSPQHRPSHRGRARKKLDLQQEVLFLMACHNFQLKGVRTVLESMRILKNMDKIAHLAIIGLGPIEEYQTLAKRLGVVEHIHFCGYVDDPVPYFMAADALVHPTFYDACSLVILEAMAAGLPVITTQFNGAAELITQGIQGFILDDPRDAPQLADKMIILLDESLRNKMGKEARFLSLNHNLEENFIKIEKIYHSLDRHSSE